VVPRNVTPKYEGTLSASTYPQYDLTSPNTRCGRGAMSTGNSSEIATVIAGSKVGFRIDFWYAGSLGGVMLHDGPLLAYLSRSPDQTPQGLMDYQAGGDWLKIHERGPDNHTRWFMPENWTQYNFTLPVTTPSGYYLLRPESIYPHSQFTTTQFYMNCAQI
ncbi:lytic polysaccharide monooxygenase, partial [Lophiostoma macrostomum CBS 122681]